MIAPITTSAAPPPAGTYSQGVVAEGRMVFLSGQTPRLPDGTRMSTESFAAQAQQVLANLEALARAVGLSLATHAVKVTVFLADFERREEFDAVFARFVGGVPPARTLVPAPFPTFPIEVDAILVGPAGAATPLPGQTP